jgi:hypothetical protein
VRRVHRGHPAENRRKQPLILWENDRTRSGKSYLKT